MTDGCPPVMDVMQALAYLLVALNQLINKPINLRITVEYGEETRSYEVK